MKRVLLLSLCIVASSALVASAYTPWVSYTQVPNAATPGYDRIIYTLNSTDFPADVQLSVLEGTWTVKTPGAKLLLTSPSAVDSDLGDPVDWRLTASASGAPNYSGLSSKVNLDANKAATAGWTRAGTSDANYFYATSYFGSWFNTGSGLSPQLPSPANRLAIAYITSGATAQFDGVAGFVGTGAMAGKTMNISFVPEPGTFVLLATGLIGAIAMWVRRRRA